MNGKIVTTTVRTCHYTPETAASDSDSDSDSDGNSENVMPGCPEEGENQFTEDCQSFQSAEDPTPRRRLTIGMIASAFENTPIPSPKLIVQPPGGKTLVNFATIFRTEANAFTESFRLLGQPIDLRIAPSSFTWRPGDGTSFSTVTPGIAFQEGRSMDDYVSHMYQSATMMHPSVDVTWSAEFRVGGGAWRPVPGTVTKQGSPVDLRVVEGKPVLVDSY